jgi:hypothetical protein
MAETEMPQACGDSFLLCLVKLGGDHPQKSLAGILLLSMLGYGLCYTWATNSWTRVNMEARSLSDSMWYFVDNTKWIYKDPEELARNKERIEESYAKLVALSKGFDAVVAEESGALSPMGVFRGLFSTAFAGQDPLQSNANDYYRAMQSQQMYRNRVRQQQMQYRQQVYRWERSWFRKWTPKPRAPGIIRQQLKLPKLPPPPPDVKQELERRGLLPSTKSVTPTALTTGEVPRVEERSPEIPGPLE